MPSSIVPLCCRPACRAIDLGFVVHDRFKFWQKLSGYNPSRSRPGAQQRLYILHAPLCRASPREIPAPVTISLSRLSHAACVAVGRIRELELLRSQVRSQIPDRRARSLKFVSCLDEHIKFEIDPTAVASPPMSSELKRPLVRGSFHTLSVCWTVTFPCLRVRESQRYSGFRAH